MKLYFSRHGESEANRLRIISNRQLPHGLTEAGKTQAAALAERLRGKPIRCIYTSPVPRAVETAEIVAKTIGISYEPCDALREYDCGILEGRGDDWAWAEHRRWVDNWIANRGRELGPEEGETYNDIQRRFVPFINNLVGKNRNDESDFLLIGHGGIFFFGLPSVLANVDFEFIQHRGFGNAMTVTAGLKDDKLVCTAWGDEIIIE